MVIRMIVAGVVALAAVATQAVAQPTERGCTLRIATTLAALPTQNGGPDQGTEGIRFMGYTLYDPLIGWDLSHADRAATLVPSIATAWKTDTEDRTRWTITVREGVRFHDGSLLDAAAVVWNLDKLFKHDAPQYDRNQAAQMTWRMPAVKAYRVLDPQHLEITTDGPDSTLPYQLTALLISSPAHWREAGSWTEFGKRPSGTGPWVMQQYEPRVNAVLTRNDAYWDKGRVPHCDRLVLLPVPDPSTRTAALLSGQVDWVEGPAPETISQLKMAHMQVLTGIMPHSWPYTISRAPGSPLNDIRVRKALNLAIDRKGMVELLNGLAVPATGVVEPGHPWYGHPTFLIHYDPAEAKRLLAEAGYGPDHPLHLKFMISTSGSGQMYPLSMNEFVQQNFAEVGVKLDFEVLEWQALRTRRDAGGAAGPRNRGIDALNNSWNSMDPPSAFLRQVDSKAVPPYGTNWGGIDDPELDRLCAAAREEFDSVKQDAILAQINARMVDQADWIFVVHDVNPRAVSPRVHGVVEAQSWYVDFSPVTVE